MPGYDDTIGRSNRNAALEEAAKVNERSADSIVRVAAHIGGDTEKRGVEVATVLRVAAHSIRDLKS